MRIEYFYTTNSLRSYYLIILCPLYEHCIFNANLQILKKASAKKNKHIPLKIGKSLKTDNENSSEGYF